MFARLSILILTVFLVCTVTPGAEPAWSEDLNRFHPSDFNGAVLAIAETSDAVYYGGEFTHVGEIEANYIVKIDKATGTVEPIWGIGQNGTNGPVLALVVIGTDLYVGGRFTTVGLPTYLPSATIRGLARWSTIGHGGWSTLSTGVEVGDSPLDEVRALTQTNGALCVGGTFSSVKSSTQGTLSANNVALWNFDSQTWSPLGDSTQNGTSHPVDALAADGSDLYLGGTFSHVSSPSQGTISTGNIAKWNRTSQTWSPLGMGTSNEVNALAIKGRELIVGGYFSSARNSGGDFISARSLARWHLDNHLWSAFGGADSNGANHEVYALAVSGEDLFVGGTFTSVSSATQSSLIANRVAKWNFTNGTWSALGSPVQNGIGSGDVGSPVLALASDQTRLWVGGDFDVAKSATQEWFSVSNQAEWRKDGSRWSEPGKGIEGLVYSFVDAGEFVYVGGSSMHRAGSLSANHIARWHKASRTWSLLGTPQQNGVNNSVHAMVLIGTDLYVGGSFIFASSASQDSVSARFIARWSTTEEKWYPLGDAVQNGLNGRVLAMTLLGPDLFVGGVFSQASSNINGALPTQNIARWNTTESRWHALGLPHSNGTNGDVNALVLNNSILYVGGSFTAVSSSSQSSITANRVAQWNPAQQEWAALGTGFSNTVFEGTPSLVNTLATNGTDLFVGGEFYSVSNSPDQRIGAHNIARWNFQSRTWAALGGTEAGLNGVDGMVRSLVVKDNDLYVGGSLGGVFSSNHGGWLTAQGIARWNTSGNDWFPLPIGVDGIVTALTVSGSELFVGGFFGNVSSAIQGNVLSSSIGIVSPLDQLQTAHDFYYELANSTHASYLALGQPIQALASWYRFRAYGDRAYWMSQGNKAQAELEFYRGLAYYYQTLYEGGPVGLYYLHLYCGYAEYHSRMALGDTWGASAYLNYYQANAIYFYFTGVGDSKSALAYWLYYRAYGDQAARMGEGNPALAEKEFYQGLAFYYYTILEGSGSQLYFYYLYMGISESAYRTALGDSEGASAYSRFYNDLANSFL